MTRVRAAGAGLGVAFGFILAWSGLADPDVIRSGLLFEDLYLFLFFFSALATASAGVHLLRWRRARTILTREPIAWERPRPERRHVVGSALFGAGWAVSAACPGPIAVQLGSGVAWSVATILGVFLGIKLFLLRERAAERPAVSTT